MSTESIEKAKTLRKGDHIMENFLEDAIKANQNFDFLQSYDKYDKEEALKEMTHHEGFE